MERNPKKSKALVITFIIVLLLLIGGYFVLKNSTKIFGTKSGNSINKIFAPLLGTSKGKNVTDINTVDNNQNNGLNTGDGQINDNNQNNNGGLNTGGGNQGGTSGSTGSQTAVTPTIVPPFIPLPPPGTGGSGCKDQNGKDIPCTIDVPPSLPAQCGDGADNDGDKLVDINDPGCHIDFNEGNNLSYDASINDESRKKDTSGTAIGGLCPDDPLVFTEDEKAELATLLRQYYLLAPTLRIEDDVTLLDYDNQTNEELVKQATTLIKDCKDQKARPGYTGPKEVKDNPYYQNASTSVTSTTTTTTTTGGNTNVTCISGYVLLNGVSYNQSNSIFTNGLTPCVPNASSGSSGPLMEACQANYVTIGGFTYNGSLVTIIRPCLVNIIPPTSGPTTTTGTTGQIGGPEYIRNYGLYELMFNIW